MNSLCTTLKGADKLDASRGASARIAIGGTDPSAFGTLVLLTLEDVFAGRVDLLERCYLAVLFDELDDDVGELGDAEL